MTHNEHPPLWSYDLYDEHVSFAGPDDLNDYAFRIEFSEAVPEARRIAIADAVERALNAGGSP
jgi:hypothetical protein